MDVELSSLRPRDAKCGWVFRKYSLLVPPWRFCVCLLVYKLYPRWRYSSKYRKCKVIHRCEVNCVQQQLSKYSWTCTIQLQSSLGPYKAHRSDLLVKKWQWWWKNNLHKNNAGKKVTAHFSVEVSQCSNWNALLLDTIPNKTKKKPKEPRKQPIPLVWYPP